MGHCPQHIHNFNLKTTWDRKPWRVLSIFKNMSTLFFTFYYFYLLLQKLGTKHYFSCENPKSKYFVYAPTSLLAGGKNIAYIDWILVINYLNPSLNINFQFSLSSHMDNKSHPQPVMVRYDSIKQSWLKIVNYEAGQNKFLIYSRSRDSQLCFGPGFKV